MKSNNSRNLRSVTRPADLVKPNPAELGEGDNPVRIERERVETGQPELERNNDGRREREREIMGQPEIERNNDGRERERETMGQPEICYLHCCHISLHATGNWKTILAPEF